MVRHRSSIAGMFASRALDATEEPDAAPGAYKGDDPAPPWTFVRGVQNMFWIYAGGLVFLIFSVSAVVESASDTTAVVIQSILLTVVALAYVATAWICDAPLRIRWVYIVAYVGLLALFAPWWGLAFLNYGVYVSIMLATLIPWRQARIAIVVWNVLIGLTAIATADITPIYIALIGGVIGVATGAGIQAGRIGARLHRAEQRVSALALAAERERIGRDLHDILGHSLTAISIKADLAQKLLEHDPTAARTQIVEVSEIARQSLADVRTTASGIREVRVATEVASARSVLLAAGIESSVPTAIEPMPDGTSELFGYVVREAVTNVVRHSEAGHCVITVDSRTATITDDGVGIPKGPLRGSGLDGLRQRMETVGGRLDVESGEAGGTAVRASLPSAEHDQPPAGFEAASA